MSVSPVSAPGATALYATITRANGKVGRRRLIAFSHPNPIRQFLVRQLIFWRFM